MEGYRSRQVRGLGQSKGRQLLRASYLSGIKKIKIRNAVFDLYSRGVMSCRDSWVYNFSKDKVKQNMKRMIELYNQEMGRLKNKKLSLKNVDQFITLNEKKIKWDGNLKRNFLRAKKGQFEKKKIMLSSYRPFVKSWLYFDNIFNNSQYHTTEKFFQIKMSTNKVICVSGARIKNIFCSCYRFHSRCLDFVEKGQCFLSLLV